MQIVGVTYVINQEGQTSRGKQEHRALLRFMERNQVLVDTVSGGWGRQNLESYPTHAGFGRVGNGSHAFVMTHDSFTLLTKKFLNASFANGCAPRIPP